MIGDHEVGPVADRVAGGVRERRAPEPSRNRRRLDRQAAGTARRRDARRQQRHPQRLLVPLRI